jgi:hypothetical protein
LLVKGHNLGTERQSEELYVADLAKLTKSESELYPPQAPLKGRLGDNRVGGG